MMRFLSLIALCGTFFPAAFSQTLIYATLTSETPGPNCAVPGTGETVPSFPIDTPRLYTWFRFNNVVEGDRFRVQWVQPDGVVFSTTDWEPSRSGSYCFSTFMEPAKAQLSQRTGRWGAFILRNANVIHTLFFNFTSAGNRAPEVTADGIVEPWTYQKGISPGGWVSIYGANLARAEESWRPAPDAPLPTSLGGVSVQIGGIPAAIAYVSGGVINVLAPGGTPNGTAPVAIQRDGVQSQPIAVEVRRILPSIYSLPDTTKSPISYFVTGALAGTAELIGTRRVDSRVLRAARPGESIDLYVTGLGRTSGGFPTDRMFSGAYPVVEPLEVDLGGTRITPQFAGLISPGLYLLRFPVPANSPPGDTLIRIVSDEFASSPNVYLTVDSGQPELTLESITLSPATITAGQSTSGTVTLSGPAPTGGVEIAVSIDSGAPTPFRVQAGARSVRFSFSTIAGSSARVLKFFARWNGMERSASLNILATPGGSALRDYETTVTGSAMIEGKRVAIKILLSIPNVISYAQVDTFQDLSSGIILYAYYLNPVISGDSATFSVGNGLGSYTNSSGGAIGQAITAGRLTVNLSSAAPGSPVTGTIQFQTATKNISTPFTGTVSSSEKVK